MGSSTSWNGRSYRDDRSIPGLTPEVWYEPALGTHWFFYYGSIIFVERGGASSRNNIDAPLGIESVLVTAGIHRARLHRRGELDDAALAQFLGEHAARPTAAMPQLVW